MYMNVDKTNNTRIRIRYPNGFEIEIEGNEAFVIKEKERIIKEIKEASTQEKSTQKDIKESISKIIDYRQNIPYIKLKIPDLDEKMAILIILTTYLKVLGIDKVNALNLSKALRLSGYILKRIDQKTKHLIKDGSINAFGTKRNRTYSLTSKGIAKASVKILNIAEKL